MYGNQKQMIYSFFPYFFVIIYGMSQVAAIADQNAWWGFFGTHPSSTSEYKILIEKKPMNGRNTSKY